MDCLKKSSADSSAISTSGPSTPDRCWTGELLGEDLELLGVVVYLDSGRQLHRSVKGDALSRTVYEVAWGKHHYSY